MSTEKESIIMKDMTPQQLEERLEVVESENAAIKAKLEKARADKHISGQWADPDWYRRARSRSRFLGVEHQQLNREIARRKREAKAARNGSIERAFVGAARLYLTSELFGQIMRHAESEVARG